MSKLPSPESITTAPPKSIDITTETMFSLDDEILNASPK